MIFLFKAEETTKNKLKQIKPLQLPTFPRLLSSFNDIKKQHFNVISISSIKLIVKTAFISEEGFYFHK